LQLKVIVNKIVNLKDILHLQKKKSIMPLQAEYIDLQGLFSELIKDFKPLLDDKNV